MTVKETPLVISAMDLMAKEWPAPNWIILDILPPGLAILAGAPKLGKSWLALQFSKITASGGIIFGRKVTPGPVLYLALEDTHHRLQSRMRLQGWSNNLDVDFLTSRTFAERIKDLGNGGGKILEEAIQAKRYRLVVIDTLSRAIRGDQNDVQEMTAWLSPIQIMGNSLNCSILMLDHHNKMGIGSYDAIHNILGSTAKGAIADTAIGLYRERGKKSAKLVITGRDVDEMTLELVFDKKTGCWGLQDSIEKLPQKRNEVLEALTKLGKATTTAVAKAAGASNRGTVHKQLSELESKGFVIKTDGKHWEVVNSNEQNEEGDV